MAEEISTIACPLSTCDHEVDGIRNQPFENERAAAIAGVLGVHGSFYADQWLHQEAVRIETELRAHLETHDIVEFVTQIVNLRNAVEVTDKALQRCNETPCPRICCSARS